MKMTKNWWNPGIYSKKIDNLKARGRIIKAIRAYFDADDFEEVETPILQVCPVMDTHIHAFQTTLKDIDFSVRSKPYLHTSPEFDMKKVMVAGLPKIYQICHVFRNCEGSKRHTPEFTMIEWYRLDADYTDIMDDCVGVLRACAERVGSKEYKYKDMTCDPFVEWERLSVHDAFVRYADIQLDQYLEDRDGLKVEVEKLGLHTADDDAWDDLFFRVMDARIEPFLGVGRPTFLCDYPVSMASLSKKKESDPRFAERFELYVCGIELANAFSELTDAEEQLARFKAEMDYKEELYGERYPIDMEFIEALRHGLPQSGGIALGVDRLVMLATGADDIQDVLWAPVAA
ncbi:MAG: EF-P lysine aminoacylase GenX [Alphaproteobacteria bacterium]|nr:EF-P lysine aminoacylase GenX [Alphaproteobacteria bacterium]